MNSLAHTHERYPTLREIAVPVSGRSLYRPESPLGFLVFALQDAGLQAEANAASLRGGVQARLESIVLRLSREVGSQVLAGLMRIRTRPQGRSLSTGHRVATPYHRTPSCLCPLKGG